MGSVLLFPYWSNLPVIRLLENIAGNTRSLRVFAVVTVTLVLLFLVDSLLIFWQGWPGLRTFLTHLGVLAETKSFKAIEGSAVTYGWIQFLAFVSVLLLAMMWVMKSPYRGLEDDAALYSRISAFIVRAAFWAVLLVGMADMIISFLRVESFLQGFVGEHLTIQLGRSIFRGSWVHYPLIGVAIVIALFSRGLGFIWLALMIVGAEFLIVVTRFVFSYEQAFMGDLVRFWYAALFLFASAYTLMHDGHVRVDVLYTNFSERGKAVTNSLGALLLGLPLCWTILILGTASKGSIITSPLRSFEISQSGFGMFTKYLMAAYLLVFAVSMAIQFTSFFLKNMARFVVPSPQDSSTKT